MKVWVGKNGLTHGPYAIERIELFVREGHLGGKDWAWCEETGQWMAIDDFLALVAKSVDGSSVMLERPERFFGKDHATPPDVRSSDDSNTNEKCDERDDEMKEDQEQKDLSMESAVPNSPEEFPYHNLELSGNDFGTTAIYPVVCKDIKTHDEDFCNAVENLEMDPGSGLVCEAPEKHLKRGTLDRWLLKEPRALFRRDKDEITDEVTNKSPRISWVRWDSQNAKTPDGHSFNDHQIGILDTYNKRLRLFPGLTANSFSFVSKMGVIVIVIKIQLRKKGAICLEDAMEWNYQMVHSGNFTYIPILIPKGGVMDEDLKKSLDERNECSISKEKVEKCFKIWPQWKKGLKDDYDDAIKWGKKAEKARLRSFPELIKSGIIKSLSNLYGREIETYQAGARGRTHFFSRFSIPDDVDLGKIDLLEGLCARCMRHPKTSPIIPLPFEKVESAEFQLLHVTGSKRVYVSCEGALSIGTKSTEFDRVWQERWDHDYLLCHLIAYHQAILCQELSWSSFAEASGAGNEKRAEKDLMRLEELNARFIEFCTHYDFSIVSSQLNQQRLYRISREVLGVPETIKEVADEIQTRLDAQRNELQKRFNEKQQDFNDRQSEFVKKQDKFLKSQENFNSLAVVFFLLGCSTFLLNLNLEPFNKDAEIAWDFSDKYAPLESLWLWVPVGLTLILFLVPKIREHLLRVVKLLFRKD